MFLCFPDSNKMPLIGNTARLIRQMDIAQAKMNKVYWRASDDKEKPRIIKHGRSLLNFGIKGVEPDPQLPTSTFQSRYSQPNRRVSEPEKFTVWKNGKCYSKYEVE